MCPSTQGQLTCVPPLRVSLLLEKLTVSIEIDTGVAYSLMSETTYRELRPDRGLDKSIVKLCTYSGEAREVLGSIPVVVTYESQAKQKARHDKTAKVRVFNKGDTVLVRNFPSGKGWIRGTIVKSLSPVSYRVTLSSGKVVKRHQDHLRHYVSSENESDQETIETPFFPSPTVDPPSAVTDRSTGSSQQNTRRYPTRDRNAPKRLTF